MTQPIDSSQRRHTFDPTDPFAEGGPIHAAARPPTPRQELDVESLPMLDAPLRMLLLGGSVPVNAVAKATAAAPPAPSAGQRLLDAHAAAYSGPYRLDGQSVTASAQFRMVGGFNDRQAGCHIVNGAGDINADKPQVRQLKAICDRAHAPDPTSCLLGVASPRVLVKVTQALVDAGFATGTADAATRIKDMQWRWGIGVDCTDYVIGAAVQASGSKMTPPPLGADYFREASTNPHLHRVSVAAAKSGDVFVLRNRDPAQVGHRAVVYSSATVDSSRAAELTATYGAGVGDFLRSGRVQILEVDSSWGAGERGSPNGGVRRNTWLYDESTQAWAQIAPGASRAVSAPVFSLTGSGPYGEILDGLYRFR